MEPFERNPDPQELPLEDQPDRIPPLPPDEMHRPVEPVEIDPGAMPGSDEEGTPLDEAGNPLPVVEPEPFPAEPAPDVPVVLEEPVVDVPDEPLDEE
jgi:hypothetical protein